MTPTIRFGRIAGIEIGVNWSVLIIASLIGWTLAASVLPELSPGSSTAAYWVAGVIVAVAFFASLLAHEMSHALVGRQFGVVADSITLWLLGGVSRFESDAPSARTELWIAIAGPAMSLALATAFGVLAVAFEQLGFHGLVIDSLLWLAYINVVLGLFNLMPAYPLDGGRVLRAALWSRSTRADATRSAVRVGGVFGWSLIILGVVLALSGAIVSGLWLVLLGWFIDNAGKLEAAGVLQGEALGQLPVSAVMSSPALTVPADLPVDAFLRDHVLARHHSSFPVVEDGEVIGLVGLDEVRRVDPKRHGRTPVGRIRRPLDQVPVVSPDRSSADALAMMAVMQSSRALVVDDAEGLLGIVTHRDLSRAFDARSMLPASSVSTGAASGGTSGGTAGGRSLRRSGRDESLDSTAVRLREVRSDGNAGS